MIRDLSRCLGLLAVAASCGGGDEVVDPCSGEPGTACVWAGTGERGFNINNPEAHRLESQLYYVHDLLFGPDGRAYILDYNNHRVRRVEADDRVVDMVGTDKEGDGAPEHQDRLPACAPEGALGTTVSLNHPTDAEFGPDGLLYIAAWHNNKIRTLDPDSGVVVTIAGDGYGFTGDGGPSCSALFNQPDSVVIDPDGTLYTIDQRNVRIRKIANDAARTITTIAGSGEVGDTGDGGQAIDATFGWETGTTPRPSGALVLDGRTLYVADSLNNRIRRIDLDSGLIDCIAGQSEAGYSGDGGPALEAQFSFPADLELGPDGRLYVADADNNAIRAIDLVAGTVETVVGGTRCDVQQETCVTEAPAREIGLNLPNGIAFDADGNLYVADSFNHRILKVYR